MPQGKHMVYSEMCQVSEDDEIRVAVDPDKMPGLVGIANFIDQGQQEDGHHETVMTSIFLKPAEARKIAAAILNGADSIDGTEPIASLGIKDLP